MIQLNILQRHVGIKMIEKLFWNVDTQNDFMNTDGALYISNAEVIKPNLAMLTKYAKDNNIKVINTADWHNEHTEEISAEPDFAKTFPAHCMEYTRGARFISETAPEDPYKIDWKASSVNLAELRNARNIVVYKDKFDVFQGSPHTNKIVNNLLKPEKAIVYGVATNVCVDAAVRGLLERKVQVYVPTDAIKELPGLPLPYQDWESLGAKLVTTKDVLKGRVWK